MSAPLTRQVSNLIRTSRTVIFRQQQHLTRTASPLHRVIRCNPVTGCDQHQLILRNLDPHVLIRLLTTSLDDRKCWKCGSKTDSDVELFFCNCGVVQEVPSDLTFFQTFHCDEAFDIDTAQLSRLYKEHQRRLHPDKYSLKSKEEQAMAADQSAFVNKAYFTLLKPLSRGLYLLELKGDPLEETNSTVNPDFLMEVMEINEELSEMSDSETVKNIEATNDERIETSVKVISEAFQREDVAAAKEELIRLKYFANIDDKIKSIYRNEMV